MTIGLLNAENLKETTLDSDITDTQTSFDVAVGTGAIFGTPPYILTLATGTSLSALRSGERVLVRARSGDTLSDVVRGYGGSTAQSWTAAGSYVFQIFVAENLDAISYFTRAIEKVVTLLHQNREGVFWGTHDTTAGDELKVAASGTPDMNVVVQEGLALIEKQLFHMDTDTTVSFVSKEPSTNPRIDIVQAKLYGGAWIVNSVEGTESATPSAPAPDSDAIKLAEIYHRVGETSIKDTDDTINGYITDFRSYVNV